MARLKVIYVVDADPMARHGLWRALTRPGWSFRLLGDARTALEAMRQLPPDLVIADLDLPGVDGVALLAEIHHRAPSVRTILVSGTEVPPGARTAVRDGLIDGLAAKPAGGLLIGMAEQLLGETLAADWPAFAIPEPLSERRRGGRAEVVAAGPKAAQDLLDEGGVVRASPP